MVARRLEASLHTRQQRRLPRNARARRWDGTHAGGQRPSVTQRVLVAGGDEGRFRRARFDLRDQLRRVEPDATDWRQFLQRHAALATAAVERVTTTAA